MEPHQVIKSLRDADSNLDQLRYLSAGDVVVVGDGNTGNTAAWRCACLCRRHGDGANRHTAPPCTAFDARDVRPTRGSSLVARHRRPSWRRYRYSLLLVAPPNTLEPYSCFPCSETACRLDLSVDLIQAGLQPPRQLQQFLPSFSSSLRQIHSPFAFVAGCWWFNSLKAGCYIYDLNQVNI